MTAGRPSEYTQEMADEICAELSAGKSMRTVCKSENRPDKSTVFRWLRTNVEFCDQYEKAKTESADALAEEMLDIADYSVNDLIITLAIDLTDKPKEEWDENDIKLIATKLNPENIQRSRLRVDTRKWIASKLKPKKYGERTILAGDVDNPLFPTDINVKVIRPEKS